VAIGVSRLSLRLGIALLILLVPAWAITEWESRRQDSRCRPRANSPGSWRRWS
jgi:hypothetical protein